MVGAIWVCCIDGSTGISVRVEVDWPCGRVT